MSAYIAARVLQALPVLVLTSIGIFLLLRAIPGDPALAIAGIDASDETLAAVRRDLALDRPIVEQYVTWVAHIARGDFGRSTISRRPVSDLIGNALPATLQLSAAALLIAVSVGLAVGVFAAVNHDSLKDVLVGVASGVLLSVPTFWLGLLAIIVFALVLGWLPPGGRIDPREDLVAGLRTLILPAIILGLGQATVIARFTRATMLEILSDAYVRTARAKGLSERTVITRHALKNALIPVVTVIGIQVGHLIGGTIVIETVFAWPGMGRLVVGAIAARDYPTVQAVLVILVAVFILVNLFTDILYGVLDPRVRLASR